MDNEHLHPDVVAFKQFVNNNPSLLIKIRKSGEPLQFYFERWKKNKEKDPLWQDVKQEQEETDPTIFDHITTISKYIDLNKIEGYVEQIQSALQMAQVFLNNKNDKDTTEKTDQHQTGPFHIFRD